MQPLTSLPPFPGFLATTPVVPQLYWDVYSAEQRWKEICRHLGALCEYADKLNVNIGINANNIAELEKQFEKFQESGFIDYYEQLLLSWINENFEHIMQTLLGIGIYFGLTSDGYFCAYVPETWGDITFSTGAVYGTNEYGRLILRYNVENGQGVIDNADYAFTALNDIITAGVVKISHTISNDSTDGVASSPDAVYAYAQPRE